MTETEEIDLTLDIQAGMKDGDTIKFDQVADEAVGHIPGDVIFHIVQVPHPTMQRDGDDLQMSMGITLLESLVGFERTFPHLDGHEVVLRKDSVSYCSEVVKIEGEGMPRRGSKKKGDLYITLSITFPTEFSPQQKELIKQAMS